MQDKFGLRVGDTVAICANFDGRLVFECDTERHRCPDISAATAYTTLTVVAGDVPLEPAQPPPAAAENSGEVAGAGAAKGSMKSADIPLGSRRWVGMAGETGPRQGELSGGLQGGGGDALMGAVGVHLGIQAVEQADTGIRVLSEVAGSQGNCCILFLGKCHLHLLT